MTPGGSARAGLLQLHSNRTSKQTKELSLTATLVKAQVSTLCLRQATSQEIKHQSPLQCRTGDLG